ncbi:MAG TPA: SRPBCC domain-containing protein [Candidatus Saccharimonadales bacterium]|nr:SRPBCC domain-containing protein [Candidatus Saccharimonadales bacterium]
MQDFKTSFTVDKTPEEVFEAITQPRKWWANTIEGDTDKLGGEFTFKMLPHHISSHKITVFEPGKKVVWHTTDSQINFVSDKEEWRGTDIVFEITPKGDKTELSFEHIGLTPKLACFNDCKGAWSFYISTSLRELIETGKGQPTIN